MLERLKKFRTSSKNTQDILLWLFKHLNIEYEEEKDEKNSFVTYHFDFQNGRFQVVCSEGYSLVFLYFQYVFSESSEYQNAIIYLCNSLNRDYHGSFYCTYDEVENNISIHIKTEVLLDETNEANKLRFTNKLGQLFALRRAVFDAFDEIKETEDITRDKDIFANSNMTRRSMYLLLEHEVQANHLPAVRTTFQHMVLTPKDIFTFRDYVIDESSIQQISFSKVHASIKQVEPSQYATFDIAAELRSIREKGDCKGEYLLTVTCADASYMAMLEWQSESKLSDYFMLTIMTPWKLKKDAISWADMPLNMVYVLDKSTGNNAAEAKFMIEDAIDKTKSGKIEDLTPIQQMLVDFADWNISDDIYWGFKYFFEGHYFQAIKHLECVANAFLTTTDLLSKSRKKVVMEVFYRLGFSYSELKLYTKAIFYLQIPFEAGYLDGCIEYVNCMVNSEDCRANDLIDRQLSNIMDQIQASQDEDDDDEADDSSNESLYFYRDFLLRRKAYLLIERQEFDKAKTLLNLMLNDKDPNMQKFAQDELRYLSAIEEQNKKADSKDDSSEK